MGTTKRKITREVRDWTVLLLKPDYVAEQYGEDTFMTLVQATTPGKALTRARKQAEAADDVADSGDDYTCLFCAEGCVRNYADGEGGVYDE